MPGSLEMRFAVEHPTAAGHFPGNPIIPGALVLDAVLCAILGGAADAPAVALRAAKFLRVVRPGDRLRIDWYEEGGETRFQCVLVDAGELAVTGMLRLGITG